MLYINTPELKKLARRAGDPRAGRVGIGQAVLGGKEKLLALKPLGKGFALFTLRYASELRSAALYFADLAETQPEASQVALAQRLIENKAGEFNLAGYTDRYQDALLGLVKTKIEGTEPVVVAHHEPGKIINLIDALRQSVEQSEAKAKPAPRKSSRKNAPLAA